MIATELAGLYRAEVANGKWEVSILPRLPKGSTPPTGERLSEDLRLMEEMLNTATEDEIRRGLYGTVGEPDVDLNAATAAVAWLGGLVVDKSKHAPYPPAGEQGDIGVA
tara:strand:- start:673 stop:999 length:327 start_codon:yes stop_codon:yes gene_type:complete